MDDTIDLTQYVTILIRRWYLVVLPALVLVILVGVWTLLRPVRYQARALIAATKLTTQVSYGTAIKTASEDVSKLLADKNQRLASFVELVRSPAVAQAVLAEVGDALHPDERSVAALFDKVTARVLPKSDLIEIKITYTDPHLAQKMVDLWAREYVRQINTLYGDVAAQSYEVIKREAPLAKADYERAQAALESLLQKDRQAELQRRIEELAATIAAVSAARRGVVQGLLAELQRTEALLRAAQDLGEQLRTGGPAAAVTNGAALTVLKLQVFGELRQSQMEAYGGAMAAQIQNDATTIVAFNPLLLQLQPGAGSASAAELISDVDSLAAVLRARRQALTAQLASLTASISQGQSWPLSISAPGEQTVAQAEGDEVERQLTQMVQQLEQQVRELKAELEQEQNRVMQAKTQRDLAWETYNNVIRKEAELALAAAASGEEVRLGAAAVVIPEARGLVKNVAIAALAGLALGMLSALAVGLWPRSRTQEPPLA